MELRIDELESLVAEVRGRRDAAPDEDSPIEVLLEWSRYSERLRRDERKLAERVDELRPRLEERVQAHLSIRREVKGLERLEEKERRRSAREREAHAAAATDEAAARTKMPGVGRNVRAAGERDAGTRDASAMGAADLPEIHLERGAAP